MIKKAFLFSFLFVLIGNSYAQGEINPYKYVIIPKKYDFLKRENQYRLNTLTKYLFDQEGFTTLLKGDTYPSDLLADPCLAVTADIVDDSNLYKTKLHVVLVDCHDNVVFTAVEGTSKIKQYDKTYLDALEKSFVSIKHLNYRYDPNLRQTNQNATKALPVAAVSKTESDIAENSVNTEKSEELVVAENQVVAENTSELDSTDPKTAESSNQDAVEPIVAVPAAPAASTSPAPSSDTNTIEPVVAVVAVPVISDTKKEENKKEPASDVVMARNYKNENISFFLIEQGDQLVAYVNESKNENYKKGELIGTFNKTSVPNFFRVSWKKESQDIDETMAHFDDDGNLKIDIHRNGKIEVIIFTEDK